jgi:predicted HTH transcriptional regulator
MTFDFPLDQVDAAKLEALRVDGVREGRQLEYKEVLPGDAEEDKRKFLAAVSSFANAAGGDLIYGLRGRRDTDQQPTGEIDVVVGLDVPNLEAEQQLRLEAIIITGLAPRIPPVTFHEIRRGAERPCLLLRIPRSWAGPHMVVYKNWSRFFSRGSRGKVQLDVHEIRAAFVAAETAYERIRRFRAERVSRILARETPTVTVDGGGGAGSRVVIVHS